MMMMTARNRAWLIGGTTVFLIALSAVGAAMPSATKPDEPPPAGTMTLNVSDSTPTVTHFRKDAAKLRGLVHTDAATTFLAASSALIEPTERVLYRSADKPRYFTKVEYEALSEAERTGLKGKKYDPQFYYCTRYGSPLIYARPLDVVAEHDKAWAAQDGFTGRRILDFGYGMIGHLRLMALCGADVTGIEVEPLLKALYSEPVDTGDIAGFKDYKGKLRLLSGRWPAEEQIVKDVAAGGAYDLIVSKNVLKSGYIHPTRPVDERAIIKLGVEDGAFVAKLHDSLKPGGYALIYNICPGQNSEESGKPYLPHADGKCPFPREMLEQAGFEVIEFDKPDQEAVLDIWGALEIDPGKGREELAKDLFAWYTLVKRK